MSARGKGSVSALGLLLLITASCSSKPAGPGSGSPSLGQQAISGGVLGGSGFAAARIQAMNASLNSSPNYAFTSADLGTLQGSGLLSAEDQAALAVLIKQ